MKHLYTVQLLTDCCLCHTATPGSNTAQNGGVVTVPHLTDVHATRDVNLTVTVTNTYGECFFLSLFYYFRMSLVCIYQEILHISVSVQSAGRTDETNDVPSRFQGIGMHKNIIESANDILSLK